MHEWMIGIHQSRGHIVRVTAETREEAIAIAKARELKRKGRAEEWTQTATLVHRMSPTDITA